MKILQIKRGKPNWKIKRLKEGLVLYELIDNRYKRIK